ncbi:MAG: hypothetical protein QM772_04590 [Ottowia sp.]|uniref:hypothetical protein n=1 Tax=Ottowia sp. TaxID=1898956 RepID=UPI0039E248DB
MLAGQKLHLATQRSGDADHDTAQSKLTDGWDRIDLERPPKLIDNDLVWFDPERGWVTDRKNLKPDGIDRAMPIVFGAAMSFMSMGAASAAMGLGAATSCTAAGATATTIGQSAILGAVGGATNQVVNMIGGGRFSFRQVLISAVSGGVAAGVTQLSGLGQMLQSGDTATRLLGHAGRAGLQGAIQQASGGRFADGFINSAMGSVASEVTQSLNSQIAQMEQQGLGASESSLLRLFSRAAGSALRVVGSNDPAAGFASDFLAGALAEVPTQDVQGEPNQAAQAEADPLGDFIADNEQEWVTRGDRIAELQDEADAELSPRYRVEVTGSGWERDSVLPDGTVVVRPSAGAADQDLRMIGDVPLNGPVPALLGYEPVRDNVIDGVREIVYRPQDESAVTQVLHEIAQRTPGAMVGAFNSFANMAGTAAQVALDSAVQVGDLLTLGYNHDHPLVQQAWSRQQQLGQSIVNTILSPRETATAAMENVVNRYNAAMALADPYEQSRALGELFNDVGQSATGLGYTAGRLIKPAAAVTTAVGENAFGGPAAGGRRAQLGAVGDLDRAPNRSPTRLESQIINEADSILNSSDFQIILAAHEAGKPASLMINNRLIQYEPNLPASGMTMFGENGFLIGGEAFSSYRELQQTVLHELHRLSTSNAGNGVSGALAANETRAAADFAAWAVERLK